MTEADCVFCKIVSGVIPAEKIFENERILVFKDLYPQAKTHLLVIPKTHRTSLMDIFPDEREMLGEMFEIGVELSRTLLPQGFRSVINTLGGGGQTVFHLHLHLIGGSEVSARFA